MYKKVWKDSLNETLRFCLAFFPGLTLIYNLLFLEL